MGDLFSIDLRNKITNVMNRNVQFIYDHNLEFFYDLNKLLIRNPKLNMHIREYLTTKNFRQIMRVYQNTEPKENNLLTPNQLKTKYIEKYLHQDFDSEESETYGIENLEEIAIKGEIKGVEETDPMEIYSFIHKMFYRLYIKGGAAIKSTVEYIFLEQEADKNIIIPEDISNPTDIDSCLIINPILEEIYKIRFQNVLLEVLNESIEEVLKLLRIKYIIVQWLTVDSLNKDRDLLEKIRNHYFLTERVKFMRNDKEPGYRFTEYPSNETFKLEKSSLKLFKQKLTGIQLFRILLDLEFRTFSNKKIGNSAAEIIDISYYTIDNRDSEKAWEWATRAQTLSDKFTLFMSFDDIISDINYLLKISENVAVSKRSKRTIRKNFLIYSYCVYKMFREHFESNQLIEFKNIKKYCLPYTERRLRNIQLPPSLHKDDLIPFFIDRTEMATDDIIKKTVHDIFLNMSYKLSIYSEKDDTIKLIKLPTISVKQFDEISEKIGRIVSQLNEEEKILFMANLVDIYLRSYELGYINFLIMIAILEEPYGNPKNFAVRLIERLNRLKNIYYMEYNDIFSNVNQLTREFVNKLDHYFPEVIIEMLLIKDKKPYKLKINQSDSSIRLLIIELLLDKLNEKFSKSNQILIQYMAEPEAKINLLLKVPISKTINGKLYENTIYLKVLEISWEKYTVTSTMNLLYSKNNKMIIV